MSNIWRWLVVGLVLSGLFLAVVTAQDEVSAALLEAVNVARSDADVPPLAYSSLLQQAAQRHSDDMAATETLSHVGSDGSQFWERIQETGYVLISGAENVLSRGDTDAEAAFEQWYNSAPHRANLLNPRYTEAGIAYTQSANGVYYFTLVLAVSSVPPASVTPSPTLTQTPTITPPPATATPTSRPTDIAAATMVAPLPTNTAAPVLPTNTRIPASLATSTPSPTPLPPDIRLIYDRNSFTLINVSGRPLNLTGLIFESEAGSLPAMRWNTDFLTQSLSGFTDGDCLQVWGADITELPPPAECEIRHAWIVVSGDALFWRDVQSFTVRNGVERVGSCDVAVGMCDVNLSVPLAAEITAPVAGSPSVGTELPDLRLIYDAQSFALVNISGAGLDLRGLVFRSEGGELAIERWETEFLTEPLSDFSAGDCLQAWTFAYNLLPKPDECRFRHAWIAVPDSLAFWQNSQSFTVERNGVVVGRCDVGRERCEIDLAENLGAAQTGASTSTQPTAIAGAADIRLHITENSITLQNTSSGNLDVSGLSFSSRVGVFEAARWNTDALSRPLTELPRLDCLQVWPVGVDRQAPAAACEIRHAWVATRPGETFWQGVNSFDVVHSGMIIGRCETRVATCDIDLP